jgi:DUF4097 and DUF4098 domain-containing protein YvlB
MTRRLLTLALLFAAATAGATTIDRTIDRTFDVRPGARVSVDNVNGRVTVTSWNQPRVRVVALQHVESHDSALANKTIANLVNINADPNGLHIRTNNPKNEDGFFSWLAGQSVHASVNYEITVPRSMNLDVETVNGTLAANGVTGALRFSTVNGRITLERCAGEVDASTTNGGIAAELTGMNPGRPVSLSTTNGRITVALPRTIAARVDAGTTNGSISSDIPLLASVSSKHSLRGTLNGGGNGGEVRLRTTNGSIVIQGK